MEFEHECESDAANEQAHLKRTGGVAGKEKWYEKIKMSYSMDGRISTSNLKEKDFLTSNFMRDWHAHINHSLPISASFTLFKYITITPQVNLRDKMYFKAVDQHWDDVLQTVERDTTAGFYNVFDFDVSLSMNTKLYGFYTPLKRLFPNSPVEKFRHVITPRVSMSYHPDFSTPGWGYYGRYTDGNGKEQVYSRFTDGNVGRGMAATLSFGVANNLEVKVVNKEDTTGKNPFKVISLIDNFEVSSGYNFAADSMNWSQFTVGLRLKFPKLNNYTLNLTTHLDPYMYEIVDGTPRRTNKQYWHNGRFPHWDGLRWNFSYTINNSTIKKWKEKAEARREGRAATGEGRTERMIPGRMAGRT